MGKEATIIFENAVRIAVAEIGIAQVKQMSAFTNWKRVPRFDDSSVTDRQAA